MSAHTPQTHSSRAGKKGSQGIQVFCRVRPEISLEHNRTSTGLEVFRFAEHDTLFINPDTLRKGGTPVNSPRHMGSPRTPRSSGGTPRTPRGSAGTPHSPAGTPRSSAGTPYSPAGTPRGRSGSGSTRRQSSLRRLRSHPSLKTKDKYMFRFNGVLPPGATQTATYETVCKDLIPQVLQGYNVTIMAYGQTGSGKTHSMMGSLDQPGITPQLVQDLFSQLPAQSTMTISFLEIYMEKVQDLLLKNLETKTDLKIREDTEGNIFVQDLTEISVTNWSEVEAQMNYGWQQRTVGSTSMNHQSSRSHAVIIVRVSQHNKSSMISLVDLAGSENTERAQCEGITMKQANHVNKSLTELVTCIDGIVKGNTHVSYRNSKLTRLLTHSLGGNAKTRILIACSPHTSNADDSYNTLKFGQRCKLIKNRAQVNQLVPEDPMIAQLKKEIQEQRLVISCMQSEHARLLENMKCQETAEPSIMNQLRQEDPESHASPGSLSLIEELKHESDSELEDLSQHLLKDAIHNGFQEELERLRQELTNKEEELFHLEEHYPPFPVEEPPTLVEREESPVISETPPPQLESPPTPTAPESPVQPRESWDFPQSTGFQVVFYVALAFLLCFGVALGYAVWKKSWWAGGVSGITLIVGTCLLVVSLAPM